MGTALRTALPALAVLTALGACAEASGAPAADPAAASQTASCLNNDLKVTVTAQADETDGTTRTALVSLTNTTKQTCLLSGWVSITLVNAADDVVTVPTTRVGQPGPSQTLQVAAGKAAFAGLKWTTCAKSDEGCGVGNTLRYDLGLKTDGPAAKLVSFPATKRNNITMASLEIGTLQPSRESVVAW